MDQVISKGERGQASEQAPIVLKSERLTVEIAPPGTLYQGTRFDWTAFITQVTLDGQHTFCVPESLVPGKGSGGHGLCNEFGIERAVGYDDAQPGECFPKLGIGLLVRADEKPYNFFRPYDIAELFPRHVETKTNEAKFVVEPVPCRGYAVRLIKTVSVVDAGLEISYLLENVGERAIVTHEYCHNFMGFDGHSIGPEYRLHMPYPIVLEKMPVPIPARGVSRLLRKVAPKGLLQRASAKRRHRLTEVLDIQGQDIGFRATPQHPFYCRLLGFSQTDVAQWELKHAPSGLTMCEFDDFAPGRIAVWGTTHVVSAEVFIDLNVAPGEKQQWTRRYEFVRIAA